MVEIHGSMENQMNVRSVEPMVGTVQECSARGTGPTWTVPNDQVNLWYGRPVKNGMT